MPRINSKLLQGMSEAKEKEFVKRYEDAEKVLKEIRDQIKKDAETELLELNRLTADMALPVAVAQVLARRQGLLKTLTYFPEE